eukprot:scaffold100651_cov18-Tisochrysis_lutea.AAC.1
MAKKGVGDPERRAKNESLLYQQAHGGPSSRKTPALLRLQPSTATRAGAGVSSSNEAECIGARLVNVLLCLGGICGWTQDSRTPLQQQMSSGSAAGTAATVGQCVQGNDSTQPGSHTGGVAAAHTGAEAAHTGGEAAAALAEQEEAAVQGSMPTEDLSTREQGLGSAAADAHSSSSSSR